MLHPADRYLIAAAARDLVIIHDRLTDLAERLDDEPAALALTLAGWIDARRADLAAVLEPPPGPDPRD